MTNKRAATLALILAPAMLATAESSSAQQPVPPETQIKEVVNDSLEILSGLLIWTGGGDFVVDHLSPCQRK
jgi:hypothetical protein